MQWIASDNLQLLVETGPVPFTDATLLQIHIFTLVCYNKQLVT